MRHETYMKIYNEAVHVFFEHFHYIPEPPNEIDFDVLEYKKLLLKCVADNYDYTIKLYGTDPERQLRKRDPDAMIVD